MGIRIVEHSTIVAAPSVVGSTLLYSRVIINDIVSGATTGTSSFVFVSIAVQVGDAPRVGGWGVRKQTCCRLLLLICSWSKCEHASQVAHELRLGY